VDIFDLAEGPEASYAEAVAEGAVLHQVDVTHLAAVEGAVAACPRVDVLVTSAGIAGPNATTWDFSPEDWRRIMSINLY
jgi:2-dehydro-3-deoxy-L-rhamnonate dehydrogenase (NAD+)